MQLIWLILRFLFPTDPIRRMHDLLQAAIRKLAANLNDAAAVHDLHHTPQARLDLERCLIALEAGQSLLIYTRVCQLPASPCETPAASARPRPPAHAPPQTSSIAST